MTEKLPLDRMICGDSAEIHPTLPEESIDLIATDRTALRHLVHGPQLGPGSSKRSSLERVFAGIERWSIRICHVKPATGLSGVMVSELEFHTLSTTPM